MRKQKQKKLNITLEPLLGASLDIKKNIVYNLLKIKGLGFFNAKKIIIFLKLTFNNYFKNNNFSIKYSKILEYFIEKYFYINTFLERKLDIELKKYFGVKCWPNMRRLLKKRSKDKKNVKKKKK